MKKIIFILYHNGANCITSKLGLTLKGRTCSPREQILSLRVASIRKELTLDYLEKSTSFPTVNRIHNFLKTAIAIGVCCVLCAHVVSSV